MNGINERLRWTDNPVSQSIVCAQQGVWCYHDKLMMLINHYEISYQRLTDQLRLVLIIESFHPSWSSS